MKKLIALMSVAATIATSTNKPPKSNFFRVVAEFQTVYDRYLQHLESCGLQFEDKKSALYQCANGKLKFCDEALQSILSLNMRVNDKLSMKRSECGTSWASFLGFPSEECKNLDGYANILHDQAQFQIEQVKKMFEDGTSLNDHKAVCK